jgi:hypothetical protein
MDRKSTVYYGDEIIDEYMEDTTWVIVKRERQTILEMSDWRFLSDQTPSQEWIDYRQFLRDLPQQFTEANDAADAWNEYEIPE